MPDTMLNDGRIRIEGLTKTFGAVRAVDALSFTVEPGRVTGFLGPNGAGKTTTLRMLLGLVRPSAGSATIGGQRYGDLPRPQAVVGAALEATGFHPGRSGRDHLRVLARAGGFPDTRVDELLETVGLTHAARRRAGEYSMGMRQRLGLAASLLGDPRVVVLDEPANGLDPEGIRWLRGLLAHLAQQGKTVLISSHVLTEVQQTVQDVVIVAKGRLIRQGALNELEGPPTVVVRGPELDRLRAALSGEGLDVTADGSELTVAHTTPDAVGALAHRDRLEVWELRWRPSDLERVFLSLTAGTRPDHPATEVSA